MDLILIQIARELLELYDSITTKELSDRIGISMSSVRHRMSEVKELFGKYGITVINVPKKGVKIEATADERDNMYNYIQELAYSTPETKEHRKDYILKTLFEYSDNYTVQLFAEDLFVSKKIISEDLKEVKKFLSKYDVKLFIKRNSGITVEGNEFDIRQAIIYHYNSLWWHKKYDDKPLIVDCRISRRAWTYMKNMYGDLDVLGVQRVLLEIEQELGIIWTDIAFSRLLEYIIILKRRIQKGWIIKNTVAQELLPVDVKYYQAAEKVLSQLSLKSDLLLEVKYLAARIFVAETIEPRETENSQFFRQTVKHYTKQIGAALGYDELYKNTKLNRQICQMLSAIQFRENYKIVDWTDSNREVKTNISGLYAVCLIHMHILEKETKLKLNPDNVAEIAILINNYTQNHRREAVYVTATDSATAMYQLGKLQRVFPERRFIKTVHYQQFNPENYVGKTIVSTVDLKRKSQKIYRITKHLDDRDIEYLTDAFNRETENANEKDNMLPFVSTELVLSASNKEDAIRKICEILDGKGLIEKGITEKIIESEGRISTAIGLGMAFPHLIDEEIEKEIVAEVKLKHRILWDSQELISTIVLVIAREEHVNDVLKYLSENKEIVRR